MGDVETRTYDRQQCVAFRKTDGRFGGLSNMAPGFPLRVNGVVIRTSEALYQACRFPHLPDIQRLIIDESSPMTAKMKSKPYRTQSRPDWDSVRVRIMRWCLRVKLSQNWNKFSALLLATGVRPIVEDSRKDDFWGAKPIDDEELVGRNVLGRLLMELREQLRDPAGLMLKGVEPAAIPGFLLYGKPIEPIDVRAGSISRPADEPRDLFGPSAMPPEAKPSNAMEATAPQTQPDPSKSAEGAQIAGFEWAGEMSRERWMKFYSHVLARFATTDLLRVTVTVQVQAPVQTVLPRIEEIRAALRDVGLSEEFFVRKRG